MDYCSRSRVFAQKVRYLKTHEKQGTFVKYRMKTQTCYLWWDAQKYILVVGIHCLSPQITFTYSECKILTPRTTFKKCQKSSPRFLLYFTFKKAQKEPKMTHFWTCFLRFSRFWVMISKIAFRSETTSQSTTKKTL